ncbi:MAG: BlaI/MecI/CopY family transcriptional regulator [Acidimicrobiales bacterium]
MVVIGSTDYTGAGTAKLAMGELGSRHGRPVGRGRPSGAGPGPRSHPGRAHTGSTTVMTILVRLWRRGRLDRQPQARAYAYRPLQSRGSSVPSNGRRAGWRRGSHAGAEFLQDRTQAR